MNTRFGVSLSGGGYRAAAFHLGTLRYLNKAGKLKDLDFLSTVSGGSIIGACYCKKVKEGMTFQEFEEYFKDRLQVSVIRKVLMSWPFLRFAMAGIALLLVILYFAIFTCYGWIGIIFGAAGLWLLVRFQFRLFPASKVIERIYDDVFFDKGTLKDLPSQPLLVINSTNLQTGRLFYFTPLKMSDSTYDGSYSGNLKSIFKHELFPIARAVMCSSSVPALFTPVDVGVEFYKSPNDAKEFKPILVDGGIYDNQGIHKLTHPKGEYECKTVVVSDAGNVLPFEGSYNNVLTLLIRTVELFMNRIKMFQMMINLYRGGESNTRQIAYVSLGWNLDNLIAGFVQNVRDGHVNEETLRFHGLDNDFLSNNSNGEIIKRMADNIKLEEVLKRQPTPEQLKLARSVSTNLKDLSEAEIDALAMYAEVMTEIQIKLYTPSLVKLN